MDGGERTAAAAPAHSHRFGTGGGVGGSEFFICFTSRPSSSMRIPSSKSLPSPGRADKYRDPAAAAPSLSASLSRRLKSSGSVKGGQSPATLPAGGGSRRKTCAFEAAEPSSPKVTCIGQVKVKTARMKKKKILRSSSQRAGRGGGEAMFRKLGDRGAEGEGRDRGEDRDCLPIRNQRWVHLPLGSICDTLRAFGSEFNCFLPCGGGRSPCASSEGVEREKVERTGELAVGSSAAEKRARDGGMWSCGAALARWLMAVQESEGTRRGEMVGMVVEEVDGRGIVREVSNREALVHADKGRGMEVPVDAEGELVAREEIQGRPGGAAPSMGDDGGESVCVPPPNALLLMRCRSDPVRMAALATRFWGSPAAATTQVEVEEKGHEEVEVEEHKEEKEPGREAVLRKVEEEQVMASGHRVNGVPQVVPVSVVAEAELKEGSTAMAVEEASESCIREVGTESGKMVPLRGVEEQLQQQSQGEEERNDGGGHCAEADSGACEDDPSWEDGEAASKVVKEAAEKEDEAGVAAATMEKSELPLPAREHVRAAAVEVGAATKDVKSISSAERQSRRPSFSNEKDEGRRSSCKERGGRRHSFCTEKEARRTSSFRDKEGRRSSFSVASEFHQQPSLRAEGEGRRRWSFSSEKEVRRPVLVGATVEEATVVDRKRKKKKKKEGEEDTGAARENDLIVEVRSYERPIAAAAPPVAAAEARRRSDELPDCLLLMMYEPKLSMEVSRETWVCSSDFLRFRPYHHRHQPQEQQPDARTTEGASAGDGAAVENKAEMVASSDVVSLPHPSPPPPPPPAPPTALAPDSAPAAVSPDGAPPPEAAKTPDKVPANGAASSPFGAPFVLTRCKSEPMRSAAKMEPDACFWKSRHRPIGAAGLGF